MASRKDPISKAHQEVEKVTDRYNELNAKFRSEAGKALENDDTEKYDSLAEDYMKEESKLRREIEVAHAHLGDARRGVTPDVTAEEESEATEQEEEPTNPARPEPDEG